MKTTLKLALLALCLSGCASTTPLHLRYPSIDLSKVMNEYRSVDPTCQYHFENGSTQIVCGPSKDKI